MHSALASALFDLKRYAEAAQSYQKAAELDVSNSNAAYNAAASYYNLKFYTDALRWYREALRRDPKHPNKEEIDKMIARLSSM